MRTAEQLLGSSFMYIRKGFDFILRFFSIYKNYQGKNCKISKNKKAKMKKKIKYKKLQKC